MFSVIVHFSIHDAHFGAFQEVVLRQAETSLEQEESCRHFDVVFAKDGVPAVYLYELYDDEAAFDLHLRTDHFKEFDALTAPFITKKEVFTGTLGNSHHA